MAKENVEKGKMAKEISKEKAKEASKKEIPKDAKIPKEKEASKDAKTSAAASKPKEKPSKPKAKRDVKITAERKKLQEKIKAKSKPVFRGNFGKRGRWRKVTNKSKWNKWRMKRGIDVLNKKDEGNMPSTGFRTPNEFRGIHPSGFREVSVRNAKEVSGLKDIALRIYHGCGKKKRKEIIAKAKEMGLKVLN